MKKSKIVLFVLIILGVLFAISIERPAQGETTTIVTGIGLDFEDDEYNVSVQLAIPDGQTDSLGKLYVISEKGKTVQDALTTLSYKMGKTIGYDHCAVVIVGEGLKDKNLLSVMDYFFRNEYLRLKTILVQADQKAVDFLTAIEEMDTFTSGSIKNNLAFSSQYDGASNISTLGDFYNHYHRKGGVSLVCLIEKEKNDGKTSLSDGGEEQGGENNTKALEENEEIEAEGGEGEDEATGEPVKENINKINNEGSVAIYKNGRFIAKADKKINEGIKWLTPKSQIGVITINGVMSDPYNNSTVTVKLRNANTRLKRKIKDGKLVLKTEISIFCEVIEILNEDKTINVPKTENNYLNNEIKAKISQNIKNEIQNSLAFCKFYNVDAFKFEHKFFMYQPSQLKKFMKEKNITSNEILEFCDIEVSVKVYPVK